MTTKRTTIQTRIGELEGKRVAFLAEEDKKTATVGGAAGQTLGDALLDAIRDQAKAAGFEVKK